MRWYSSQHRELFLAVAPPEVAPRLARLWEALPQSWVCALGIEAVPVVYYCFVSTGAVWIEEFGRYRFFAPDEAYVHTCYTLPPYRGRGFHSLALQCVRQWLAQRGFRQAFAVVAAWNLPSLRGFERAGFEVAGSVVYWHVLGHRYRRPVEGVLQ